MLTWRDRKYGSQHSAKSVKPIFPSLMKPMRGRFQVGTGFLKLVIASAVTLDIRWHRRAWHSYQFTTKLTIIVLNLVSKRRKLSSSLTMLDPYLQR